MRAFYIYSCHFMTKADVCTHFACLLRQQMVKMLDEKQRMTVTEIYVALRLEQSVASQHLAILRRAGIVKTERDGKFIYYHVNYDRLDQINHLINELLG